jgi:hypothetical protein
MTSGILVIDVECVAKIRPKETPIGIDKNALDQTPSSSCN